MPRQRLLPVLALALGLLAVVQALWAAWDQGWTYDEPFHLRWTERLLDTGVWERESQERFNSKTPVMIPNVLLRTALRGFAPQGSTRGTGAAVEPEQTVASEARLPRWAARIPSIAWLCGILTGTFLLGRRLFGAEAAALATIAAALDPNLVAHGSLATVDAVYAFATLLTVAASVRFAAGPSLRAAFALGLAVGLAFTTKFSAFLLLPTVLLAVMQARPPRPAWTSRVMSVCAAVVAATAVVCAAYLFAGFGTPLSGLRWHSAPFTCLAAALPGLRLPLPAPFLTGVDLTLASERADWNVVILGHRHPRGVWYYFLLLWLVKTPVLVLAGTVYGLVRAARRGLVTRASLVATTLAVHLAYFSLLFHAQVGYRFVLGCLPLLYVLAGAGLAPLLQRRVPALALAVAGAVALFENALFVGNPLSFTNAAVWPKRRAFRLVADSNLDWGQNRDRIEGWLEAAKAAPSRLDPPHFVPGYNAFGVNTLAGVWDFERHRFLREHGEPAGHYGHTYLWFDVDNELFDRFMNEERRLTPFASAAGACADVAYDNFPAGSQAPFSSSDPLGAGRSWLVCVSVRKLSDLGLRSEQGQLRIGRNVDGEPCEGDVVGAGQSVWYRLEPGVHAFCAAEVPGRRAWIPHGFDARWVVRGHGVAIGRREVESLKGPTPPPPEGSSPRSSSPPPGPEG